MLLHGAYAILSRLPLSFLTTSVRLFPFRFVIDPDIFNMCNYFSELCTNCMDPYRRMKCYSGESLLQVMDIFLARELKKVSRVGNYYHMFV